MKSGNIRKYVTGLYIFWYFFFLFVSFIYLTELGLPLSSCDDQGLLQLQWAGFPLWWLLRAQGLGAAASVTVVQGLSCPGVFLDQGQILYHWTTQGRTFLCFSFILLLICFISFCTVALHALDFTVLESAYQSCVMDLTVVENSINNQGEKRAFYSSQAEKHNSGDRLAEALKCFACQAWKAQSQTFQDKVTDIKTIY